jgi:mRNA-degrading endonuclease RelE of RelBE toxin-antitoxin system
MEPTFRPCRGATDPRDSCGVFLDESAQFCSRHDPMHNAGKSADVTPEGARPETRARPPAVPEAAIGPKREPPAQLDSSSRWNQSKGAFVGVLKAIGLGVAGNLATDMLKASFAAKDGSAAPANSVTAIPQRPAPVPLPTIPPTSSATRGPADITTGVGPAASEGASQPSPDGTVVKKYQVIVTKRAREGLRNLPRAARARILEFISSLADQPRPREARMLHGGDGYSMWSVRLRTHTVVVYALYDAVDGPLVIISEVHDRTKIFR